MTCNRELKYRCIEIDALHAQLASSAEANFRMERTAQDACRDRDELKAKLGDVAGALKNLCAEVDACGAASIDAHFLANVEDAFEDASECLSRLQSPGVDRIKALEAVSDVARSITHRSTELYEAIKRLDEIGKGAP